MKLYIDKCNNCRNKIYMSNMAYSRAALARQIGADPFRIRCGVCGFVDNYSTRRVWAEDGGGATAAGGVIGGLVGLLGGPIGVLIGAGLGAALGGADDTEEQQKVKNFNNSW